MSRKYTFEVLTLAGEWEPLFCRSLNSTDPETGSSLIACKTAKPYACYGQTGAAENLAYFARHGGADRVRIANQTTTTPRP